MKIPQLRDLTIVKASEKAKALGLPRQSAKNIRKKWSVLYGLFEHAAVAHSIRNPFVAKALLVHDKVPANRRREIFEDKELEVLLASDLPAPLYWLTWLGLYMGARLNELCQLTSSHFRQHGAIHYIFFSPELRLKTGQNESCVRSVPIHSRLIELGLLDYVKECAGPLFPGLTRHKSGRYSDAPSKAFSRHLVAIGIKRVRLSYHSLRKTFAARLMVAAPAEFESRERLVGHATKGVAAHYRGSYEAEAHDMKQLKHRAQLIERLKF